MSFMNFGDDGLRAWGYEIAYSIDQRGLKYVVERNMPEQAKVLFKHRVTNVDWSGTDPLCPSDHPVRVDVEDLNIFSNTKKTWCTKRVISTVSVGVLAENEFDNMFQPQIDMSNSPFEMGNLVKVYFRFPKKFWENRSEYITFLMKESFRKNTTGGFVRGEYFYNLDNWFKNDCRKYGEPFCDTKSMFLFLSTPDLEVMGLHNKSIDDQEFADKIWQLLDPLRKKYGSAYVEPDCWYFYDWNERYYRGGKHCDFCISKNREKNC